MRKYFYVPAVLLFLWLFTCHSLLAQPANGDSSSQKNAFNHAISLFYASTGNQSSIYNGPEYYFYDPLIKGNAYFLDINAFTEGSVNYDGIWYSGVQMLYDLNKDEVVVLLYNHFSKFSLINEKVKRFDFLGHHFKNIIADTIMSNYNKSDLKSGFYDELYNGKTEILAKRVKNIQVNSGGLSGIENYFSTVTEYYLKKGPSYYHFSGKSSFLDVLKDKKKELQQYIKSDGINFRAEPEDAMVKIAAYYDHLTN